MSELVATWNDVASSGLVGFHITKAHRGMIGTPRDVFVPTPGREGAWAFAERRGNRHITAECAIGAASVGTSSRHTLIGPVADWFDVPGPAHLVFSDQPDRYWLAFAAGDPDPDEWREKATFSLEWECSPYAFALEATSECATATGGNGDGTVTVPGTLDAFPEITITGIDDYVDSFTITANGYSLTVIAASPVGIPFNLSSLSDTVTQGVSVDEALLGAYDPTNLVMQRVSGDFPILSPGANPWSIQWDGAATQVRVCFRYRRRYR